MDTSGFDGLNRLVDSHEACCNAFFLRCRTHRFGREELTIFGREYRYWISQFPGILAYLIASSSDMDFQFFLSQILFSELGSGNPERMHYRLFERVLERVGVLRSEMIGEPMLEETRELVNGMRELYGDADILRAMGAQYALERQAFPMIEQLYCGFKHYSWLTSEDCDYFEVHLVEEPEHLKCMQECMIRCISSQEDVIRVNAGAVECLNLIAGFWRRMNREIRGRELKGVEMERREVT